MNCPAAENRRPRKARHVVHLLASSLKHVLRPNISSGFEGVEDKIEDAVTPPGLVLTGDQGVVEPLPFGVSRIDIHESSLAKYLADLEARESVLCVTQSSC